MDYDTLVLPGGGIKGFFLLGGVQVCQDKGLFGSLKNYIGTSIGSIICYLLCIGYTPIEIVVSLYKHKCLEKMQCFNLIAMIECNGAISFGTVQESLEKLTIEKIGYLPTLGKIKEKFGKNLVCVSYNTTKCITEYLSSETHPDLPCITALRMSCNIPLIFDRFKYMDSYYIDGGISDNFAILKGEEIGEKVFGIFLSINEDSIKDDPKDGIVSYFLRLLQIPIIQSTKYKINSTTSKSTIVNIDSGEIRNYIEFNIKSKTRLEMFSQGYTQVKNFLEKN
jgi:predicted acylesterase/phospholipase RssA